MLLFENKVGTLEGPIPYGMGPFDYLDQSARPEAAKVRALLEEMLTNFPGEHAPEMANRLRSTDETTHNAAFLELCLHEILLRRGYVIEEVEGSAPGSSKRPDYLARTPEGSDFYDEATVVASGLSDKELAAERRLSAVLDTLRLLQHPRFMVAVERPVGPTNAISVSALRKDVFAGDAIRKKLFVKAGRCGSDLVRPFFIAVSSTQVLQRDEDFEQVAFGRLAHSWVGDSPDVVVSRPEVQPRVWGTVLFEADALVARKCEGARLAESIRGTAYVARHSGLPGGARC